MNKLKNLFTSLKFIVLAVLLTGFVLATVFCTKTSHSIETATHSSDDPNVSAQSSGNANVATQSSNNPNVATQSSDSTNLKVWVNTDSGVYHCPKTRWYGNTKHGEFMTQREAQSKGYRPARGTGCS